MFSPARILSSPTTVSMFRHMMFRGSMPRTIANASHLNTDIIKQSGRMSAPLLSNRAFSGLMRARGYQRISGLGSQILSRKSSPILSRLDVSGTRKASHVEPQKLIEYKTEFTDRFNRFNAQDKSPIVSATAGPATDIDDPMHAYRHIADQYGGERADRFLNEYF